MKNDQLLRDLGRAYGTQANEFLREKFGTQMELRELGVFYGSAASWMIAKSFAMFFEKASPAEAQTYLQEVLSGLSANIRLQKIPVMVKVEVGMSLTGKSAAPETAIATPSSSEPEPELEQEPEPPKGCACKLVGGHCAACAARVSEIYRDLASHLLVYMKAMGEKAAGLTRGCQSCGIRYSDQALASIAKDGIPEFKGENPDLIGQVFGALTQFAGAMGVAELPLTQKAIEEKSE